MLILAAAGVYATLNTPVDAIPDLSENQVIVFTDWPGRSSREIEDQVTYPLSLRLQGLAGIRTVRSSSEFNFSTITLIFEDKTDFYFARQRVTEKLGQSGNFLPTGVSPYLAPDATALGQVFWHTLEPGPGRPLDPGQLWAINKFYVAPQLNAVPGVSEVAPPGGAPLEYQIDVRPEMLRAYGVTLGELFSAVSRSNQPAGGGVIQKNNAEYIVRGVGWIRDKTDIENTVIREVNGVPVYVKTVATVQLGTQFRRSVFEKDGNEVVGGGFDAARGKHARRHEAGQGEDPRTPAGPAAGSADRVLRALEDHGFIGPAPHADGRDGIVNEAVQKVLERFGETMRELALRRFGEFEQEPGPVLVRFVVTKTLRRMRASGHLGGLGPQDETAVTDELAGRLSPEEGRRLAKRPASETITRIQTETAGHLTSKGFLADPAAGLEIRKGWAATLAADIREAFDGSRATLAGEVLAAAESKREDLWRGRLKTINWELCDRGVEAFTWYAMEELAAAANHAALLGGRPRSP
ncbi:efflux RND transporter permease subunit [Zavarzinella formosa]|uniref:efflux RND transporter permease subunit n=1 Tax=Zavarzinella formosa TaxID=360055 RepID=UPI0003120B6E|nr:efflux RND transporter permease subunit [Zavarzinella formosa]